MSENDFSGVWKSSYMYYDKARDSNFRSEYYVSIKRKDDTLIVESIPEYNTAYLFMRLYLDNNLATGSWREESSREGFYKGLIYIGAVQLVIADDHKSMHGKWIAWGKYKTMNDGPWDLEYVAETLPKGTKIVTEIEAEA